MIAHPASWGLKLSPSNGLRTLIKDFIRFLNSTFFLVEKASAGRVNDWWVNWFCSNANTSLSNCARTEVQRRGWESELPLLLCYSKWQNTPQLICISLSKNNLSFFRECRIGETTMVRYFGVFSNLSSLTLLECMKVAVSSACLLWMVFHFPRVHALSSNNQLCFSNVNAVKLFTPDDWARIEPFYCVCGLVFLTEWKKSAEPKTVYNLSKKM